MGRIKNYCEVDFLDKLFSEVPEFSFLDNNASRNDWQLIMELIYSKSNLVFSNTDELINKTSNPYFKKLIKNSMGGGSKIEQIPNWNAGTLSDTRSIIMSKLCDEKFCQLLLSNDNWQEQVRKLNIGIFKKVSPNNQTNEFVGWSLLRELTLPINAAIIADNYILNNKESINENLFEIIRNLLPSSCKIDFHLSLLVDKELVNPQGKLIFINDFINSLKLTYFVQVTIFLTRPNEPHDRDIITNYWWLHSGHSFDYYRNGTINKTTTVAILGLSRIGENKSTDLLYEFKSLMTRGKKDWDMFGFGSNRLLDEI